MNARWRIRSVLLGAAFLLAVGATVQKRFRGAARRREDDDCGRPVRWEASRQRQGLAGRIHTFDPVSFNALARMLARPDARDLPRRGHVCRYEGDPNRRVTRLPKILMGWLQRRHLETDVEQPLAPATTRVRNRGGRRANPGLRVLRPTGSS